MDKIPYSRQCIGVDDIERVSDTLRSDFLTQGPMVKEFEQRLADSTGSKYAIATANGTMALFLAYQAAGIKKGDEAITSPNTFVATSNMLIASGAKPVFADINLDTYNLDEDDAISKITGKTRAVVPVYFGGAVTNYKRLRQIAKKKRILLIADAAHALGALSHGKKPGELADMTVLSFHPVKSITTGEGGAVLTNNKVLYERLRSLSNHGTTKDKDGFNVMRSFGWNARLSDISASLGLSQLAKLSNFIERRRRIALKYRQLLSSCEHIILPPGASWEDSAWHLFVIRVKNPKIRMVLYRELKNNSIGVNFHYPAVYSHPYYRKNGYAKIKLDHMEEYANTAISIPIHPLMTDKEVEYVCSAILNFFRKK